MPMIPWGLSLGEQTTTGDKSTAAASRAAAAQALKDVLGSGHALDEALETRLARLSDPRDRGLASEIAYGVLRRLPGLRDIARRLLKHPFKTRDLDLECLLLAGLYQLQELRVPAHAAVSETVAAARLLRKNWATALLNAVLRSYQRRKMELEQQLEAEPEDRHDFPDWLLKRLRQAWPDAWENCVSESNRHPPMVLRVNSARIARQDYAERLAAAGIANRSLPHAQAAIRLDRPVGVDRLPGFSDGLVSVQDGAAQLAAQLLEAHAGERVLDACAAPGGKTGHILELTPDLDLTAVDKGPKRLAPLHANLTRLGLQARVLDTDLTVANGPWADRLYQRILLDAPCSATGVIRRHPDIKWLRRERDIAPLTRTQDRILDALWSSLAPGGMLVYATCSLLPEENHLRVQAFLSRTIDAREAHIQASWGRASPCGRQLLTGDDDMDGFYYARLLKSAQVPGP